MKIKDLKKYARLETGRIFETEKEMPNLWQPSKNKIELRACEFVSGAVFSMSIPVVATADTIAELEK